MGVKKVSIGDEVIIDLTRTTLQASEAPVGKKFYDNTGSLITGTYTEPVVQIDTNNEFTAGTSQITKNAEEGKYFSSVIIKPTPTEEKEIIASTTNTTVSSSDGKHLSKVTVKPTPTEEKEIIASTTNTTVSSSDGKHLSKVTVKPTPTEEKEITPTISGATVTPSTGKHLSKVTVKPLQNKEVNSTLFTQTIAADPGYSGLHQVTIRGYQEKFIPINNLLGEGL